jgi:hypothetical protein
MSRLFIGQTNHAVLTAVNLAFQQAFSVDLNLVQRITFHEQDIRFVPNSGMSVDIQWGLKKQHKEVIKQEQETLQNEFSRWFENRTPPALYVIEKHRQADMKHFKITGARRSMTDRLWMLLQARQQSETEDAQQIELQHILSGLSRSSASRGSLSFRSSSFSFDGFESDDDPVTSRFENSQTKPSFKAKLTSLFHSSKIKRKQSEPQDTSNDIKLRTS